MSALGQHAGFIVAAYAAVVVVLGTLIGWIVADGRRQDRLLAELEARGLTRRSAQAKARSAGGGSKSGKPRSKGR